MTGQGCLADYLSQRERLWTEENVGSLRLSKQQRKRGSYTINKSTLFMKSAGKTEILLAQLFMVNFNPFQWIVASHVGKLCHWIFIQTCQKTLKSMKFNLLLVNGHQIAQNSQN